MTRTKKVWLWIGAVLTVAATATAVSLWGMQEHHENDQRFHKVKSGVLYRAVQPAPLMPEHLTERNIARVFNLRARSENPAEFDAEQAVCDKAGVEFINMPMGGVLPSDQQLEAFLRGVTLGKGASLVHCAQGRSRTGIMSAAFLVVVEGWTPDRAMTDILEHGDRSDGENLAQKQDLLNRLYRERGPWMERIGNSPASAPSR